MDAGGMTRLLFVHLAKTGGISVRRILKASKKVNSFDCIHNHFLLRFQYGRRVERRRLSTNEIGPYPLAFLMVRHPLERLISCHSYFRAGGLNAQAPDKRFPADQLAQQFIQQLAPSLEECCHQLPEIAEHLPHFKPMSFWLDALPNPLADRVFTGRQENFDADLKLLFHQLQVPLDPVLLQRSNSSGPKKISLTSMAELSTDALAKLQVFYAEDFRRFNYSLKLEAD